MFGLRRRQKIEALVSLYARTDGYYLVPSTRTTEGVWTHVGSAARIAPDGEPTALATTVLELLSVPLRPVRHPRQDEWSKHRRESLGPLMILARVRSWKGFELGAGLVQVHRHGAECTVTPMVRMASRPDAWEPEPSREQLLLDPEPTALGKVIRASLDQ